MSIANLANTDININTTGDINCNELFADTFSVDTLDADNLECNKLKIKSVQGIVTDLGPLNLTPNVGDVIRLNGDTYTPVLYVTSIGGINSSSTDLNLISAGNINLTTSIGATGTFIDKSVITPGVILTSINGIKTNSTDLNLTANNTSSINLEVTNGAINIGNGTPVVINNKAPVVFKNPYTTISTISSFTGYSDGVFSITWTGPVLNAPVQYLVGYYRIGSLVFINFGPITFIKGGGPTSILTTVDPIPFDLRDTDSLYDQYMYMNINDSGVIQGGSIWLDMATGHLKMSRGGNLPFISSVSPLRMDGGTLMIGL
jgi:hypothetical protein